jgi:hypothetical protein
MLQYISSYLPFLLQQTPPQNCTQVVILSRCNARKIYSRGRLHPVPPPRPSSSRHQTISRLPLPSCRRRPPISRKATQIYLFLTVRSGTWMRTMLTSAAKAGAVPAQRRAARRSLMYCGEIFVSFCARRPRHLLASFCHTIQRRLVRMFVGLTESMV